MLQYIKPSPLQLKTHPLFTERWVQERIIEDPTILGLGDLEVKDVERIQPKAGRLDMLLRDPETDKRYEVELMLGPLDESHIIRTIEYWDIERKRYPQYDHCPVIVAENITSRFLNVLGLFNNAIPIIALQLSAYQIEDRIFLTFTKVLDEVIPGDDDEGEIFNEENASRAYWDKKSSPVIMNIADEFLQILKEIDKRLDFNYTKSHIGIYINDKVNTFIITIARKGFVRFEIRINDMDPWRLRLDEAKIVYEVCGKKRNRLGISANTSDVILTNRELIKEIIQAAYAEEIE